MGEPKLEGIDFEKCRARVNLAVVLLLNQRECEQAEITGLDYYEAIRTEKIIREEWPKKSPAYKFSCERIPVVDINSNEESYKLIIRRK